MVKKISKNVKFDYSWVIIGISFLVVATTLGLCSSGGALYLTAITEALNIPRSAFSITDTIRYVATALANVYFGRLVYKFGTKKLISAGFICLIGFAIIRSFAESMILFYLASILLGLGLSWTSTTMVSTIVNKWCTKNKGTITGLILSANGIGGAIAVQILTPIIFNENDPFGYRTSYYLVAAILAVVLLLVIFLYRESPKGVTSDNIISDKKKKIRGAGWIGMDYAVAVKKPYFYISVLCVLVTGMTLTGLGQIAIPHMYDIGIDMAIVATISSVSSIALTCSKFTTGFMYDRLGLRPSLNICYICSLCSVFGLVILTNTPLGHTIAFIRGVLSSFALPLETVMLSLIVTELFGNKDFSRLIGVYVSANYVGYAIGAPVGNFCFDFFGSYNIAFIIFGLTMIFVFVAMQFVISAAKKDKDIILKEAESL